MNELILPGLTLLCGLAGGFAGARGAIVRLETQMDEVRKRLEALGTRMHRHNDDLLIHDMELETVLAKLDIPRARRQRLE
jgi:hypothetical protein